MVLRMRYQSGSSGLVLPIVLFLFAEGEGQGRLRMLVFVPLTSSVVSLAGYRQSEATRTGVASLSLASTFLILLLHLFPDLLLLVLIPMRISSPPAWASRKTMSAQQMN